MSPSILPVELNEKWDVLGPFPIHAREQHYVSPAFPLNLSEPIAFDKKWPSAYADGGLVEWSTTTMNDRNELRISFPTVRWKYLRSFEGWAALQHHAVLRTTFTLPSHVKNQHHAKLYVHLHQGSYFTVLPKDVPPDFTPKWYAGNIYDLPRSIPHAVDLPPSATGEYQLFVSGDYEIRLFGDPVIQEGSDVPVQNIKIEAQLEAPVDGDYKHESSLDVVGDFVDGFVFGDAIGIGLTNTGNTWLTVESAATAEASLEVSIRKAIILAPEQTRIVPIMLAQRAPYRKESLEIALQLTRGDAASQEALVVEVPLQHLEHWSSGDPNTRTAIKVSFFFTNSIPAIFGVLPPLLPGRGSEHAPILALHGAGVDVEGEHLEFWKNAMPKNDFSWIILPVGRTSWGLDWHGPSALEAWGAVAALSNILRRNEQWRGQAYPKDTKVVLIGHSNGGQGVWHLATHFPDRVLAAVPAAAYSKSQAYVSLSQSRSARYIDPALRAILESSLTPDDNDLHLSNTATLPLLAVHGGADENVPSWHSRELISVLKTLNPTGDARLREDPGKGHWYDTVLNSREVQDFVDKHVKVAPDTKATGAAGDLMLTVSNPRETGSLRGWKVQSLIIPGRMGVLRIGRAEQGVLKVSVTNVQKFSVEDPEALSGVTSLVISTTLISTIELQHFPVTFERGINGSWNSTDHVSVSPSTRLQTILSSPGTIKIAYPDGEAPARSLARRIAHDLLIYHRLNGHIVEGDSLTSLEKEEGNTVIIGTLKSKLIKEILSLEATAFNLRNGILHIVNRALPEVDGEAFLFLHPASDPKSTNLVIIYTNEASLERAGRLFPIRTGVSAPNWLHLSPAMDRLGAAGLRGAGVWGSNWKIQPESSWADSDA